MIEKDHWPESNHYAKGGSQKLTNERVAASTVGKAAYVVTRAVATHLMGLIMEDKHAHETWECILSCFEEQSEARLL